MLLAIAGPAQAVDWSKAQTVTVVTVEYAFQPSSLSFKRGRVYRLHLENRGKETHEFTAPDFFKAITMRNPGLTGPDHVEIVLQPGGTQNLYFVADQPGKYDLRCADHDWAGMTGDITILP